nr:hypothetical protein [Candidatus Frankia alpina]
MGHTELDGVGQLVAEVSPYAQDLDWSEVNEPEHDLVNFSTEDAIHAAECVAPSVVRFSSSSDDVTVAT